MIKCFTRTYNAFREVRKRGRSCLPSILRIEAALRWQLVCRKHVHFMLYNNCKAPLLKA